MALAPEPEEMIRWVALVPYPPMPECGEVAIVPRFRMAVGLSRYRDRVSAAACRHWRRESG